MRNNTPKNMSFSTVPLIFVIAVLIGCTDTGPSFHGLDDRDPFDEDDRDTDREWNYDDGDTRDEADTMDDDFHDDESDNIEDSADPEDDSPFDTDTGEDAQDTSEEMPDDETEPDPGDAFSCLQADQVDLEKAGKYTVKTSTVGKTKIYAPQNLPTGCKVPVVHLSNGTGAWCGFYASILNHLASHGFITACYESTQTGSGAGCIQSIDTLFKEFPSQTLPVIGSTGHSQGGGAAITCTYLAEKKWGDQATYAGHAIEPAHGMSRGSYKSEYPQITSPIFIMSGSADTVVSHSWVKSGYDLLDTETYWYQAVGASHLSMSSWAAESAVAWFRWKLLGDSRAEEIFLSLPNTRNWKKIGAK